MNLDDIWFLLEGCSGKIHDRVYYQLKGVTWHRKAPGSYNKISTPKQALARENLLEANAFARNAMRDPQQKAFYESIAIPPQHAFNAAVSDYLKKKKLSNAATHNPYCMACCCLPVSSWIKR